MFLVVLAYLAFFSTALPDAMLGVDWPSMRLSFHQPLGAAGLVPPFGVAATLVSTALAGVFVARVGIGRLLALSTLLSAGALVLSATSTTLAQFLLSVVLLGLSSGAIDVTLNAYAARAFGARRISFLHASYVIGAAASPLIVTIAIQTGSTWRLPYGIVAVLQLLLAAVFFLTRSRWATAAPVTSPPTQDDHQRADTRRRRPARRITAGLGIVAVVVQTGIESSVALWAYTFLTTSVGVGTAEAGTIASGYWLAMFAGRVVLGSLAERVGTWQVLGLSVIGLVVAAALALVGTPVSAALGILAFGLAAGPIYPLLILTTAERSGPNGVDRLVAAQTAASGIGAATLPSTLGLAMNVSPALFAPIMVVAAVAAGLLHLAMRARRDPSTTHR